MDRDKVLKLATLARIDISEQEAESFSGEFETILGYVGEVKSATADLLDSTTKNTPINNVWREDSEPHESGHYTEKILKEVPKREGDFIKVKNIF